MQNFRGCLAEMLACPFWTADERLYNAVKEQLSWVRWLGVPNFLESG